MFFSLLFPTSIQRRAFTAKASCCKGKWPLKSTRSLANIRVEAIATRVEAIA